MSGGSRQSIEYIRSASVPLFLSLPADRGDNSSKGDDRGAVIGLAVVDGKFYDGNGNPIQSPKKSSDENSRLVAIDGRCVVSVPLSLIANPRPIASRSVVSRHSLRLPSPVFVASCTSAESLFIVDARGCVVYEWGFASQELAARGSHSSGVSDGGSKSHKSKGFHDDIPWTPRRHPSVTHCPPRNSLILIGGLDSSSLGYLNDVFEYSLRLDRWTRLRLTSTNSSDSATTPQSQTTTTTPARSTKEKASITWHSLPRIRGHSATYDPASNSIFIFGGEVPADPSTPATGTTTTTISTTHVALSNAIYALDLSTLAIRRILIPAPWASPPPRRFHTAWIIGNKLCIYGGYSINPDSESFYPLSDIWSFDILKERWRKDVAAVAAGGTSVSAQVKNRIYVAPCIQKTLDTLLTLDIGGPLPPKLEAKNPVFHNSISLKYTPDNERDKKIKYMLYVRRTDTQKWTYCLDVDTKLREVVLTGHPELDEANVDSNATTAKSAIVTNENVAAKASAKEGFNTAKPSTTVPFHPSTPYMFRLLAYDTSRDVSSAYWTTLQGTCETTVTTAASPAPRGVIVSVTERKHKLENDPLDRFELTLSRGESADPNLRIQVDCRWRVETRSETGHSSYVVHKEESEYAVISGFVLQPNEVKSVYPNFKSLIHSLTRIRDRYFWGHGHRVDFWFRAFVEHSGGRGDAGKVRIDTGILASSSSTSKRAGASDDKRKSKSTKPVTITLAVIDGLGIDVIPGERQGWFFDGLIVVFWNSDISTETETSGVQVDVGVQLGPDLFQWKTLSADRNSLLSHRLNIPIPSVLDEWTLQSRVEAECVGPKSACKFFVRARRVGIVSPDIVGPWSDVFVDKIHSLKPIVRKSSAATTLPLKQTDHKKLIDQEKLANISTASTNANLYSSLSPKEPSYALPLVVSVNNSNPTPVKSERLDKVIAPPPANSKPLVDLKREETGSNFNQEKRSGSKITPSSIARKIISPPPKPEHLLSPKLKIPDIDGGSTKPEFGDSATYIDSTIDSKKRKRLVDAPPIVVLSSIAPTNSKSLELNKMLKKSESVSSLHRSKDITVVRPETGAPSDTAALVPPKKRRSAPSSPSTAASSPVPGLTIPIDKTSRENRVTEPMDVDSVGVVNAAPTTRAPFPSLISSTDSTKPRKALPSLPLAQERPSKISPPRSARQPPSSIFSGGDIVISDASKIPADFLDSPFSKLHFGQEIDVLSGLDGHWYHAKVKWYAKAKSKWNLYYHFIGFRTSQDDRVVLDDIKTRTVLRLPINRPTTNATSPGTNDPNNSDIIIRGDTLSIEDENKLWDLTETPYPEIKTGLKNGAKYARQALASAVFLQPLIKSA